MQGSTVVVPRSICVTPRSAFLNSLSRTACTTRSDIFGVNSGLFGDQSLRLRESERSSRKSSKFGDDEAQNLRGPKLTVTAALLQSNSEKAASQDVVYEGIAQISKKRVSVGNLIQADLTDGKAALEDNAFELVGKKIQIQLVSVDLDDKTKGPKLSAVSTVEGWLTNKGDADLVADVDDYSISFSVPQGFGEPGAFVIQNHHKNELFLEKLTLQAPDGSKITFNTLAWIYPHDRYPKDRVFFSSKLYLPSATPAGLQAYREQELEQYRGDGTGMREAWDRIYDYDVYNDIGNPDKDIKLKRPPLGGNQEYPYPRRMRTGRPPCVTDPESESRVEINVPYIPSDEWFLRTKNSTFIASAIKAFAQSIEPSIKSALGDKSFQSFSDIDDLYKNGLPIQVPESVLSSDLTPEPDGEEGSLVYFNDIFVAKGEATSIINYPPPQVYKADHTAWETDVEFGRQALSGVNPTRIELLKSYPPVSTLDPKTYGNPKSSLTEQHILPYLEGLTVAQAITAKKLFTIDHHDAFFSFIERANADTDAGFQCYAPRTIYFYNGKGQMMPVAIELSLPPTTEGGNPTNKVFTPADASDHIWNLAKLHATSIDSNFHQVVSHFTFAHGNMEPFIIASNRQLSDMHPIKSLLLPHFKDTLNINSGAREALINAGATIEKAFSMGQYAMRLGATAYGSLWRFDQMAIPENLISRGMAEPADSSYPGSVKLLVEDYPWAKDGLEVWDALKMWVSKYCQIVYKGSDTAVKEDKEIQAWWQEIVNVGHGDLKDRPWWPKPDSIESLAQIVTIIGWTGPFHASINFGQYAYTGHPLNKPSGTRKFIPEKTSSDYSELQSDPEKFILSTTTSSSQATTVMTVVELLNTHSVDEEYIGAISLSTDWTANPEIEAAFREFSSKVATIADNITKRNNDKSLVNRNGPAKVPYTLFYPNSTTGLTGRGVPYSTSI